MTPRVCPRFEIFSGPICRLESYLHRTQLFRSDRICSSLCELIKPRGEARLRGSRRTKLVETLAMVRLDISARWGRLRMQLDRSGLAGSERISTKRLQNARGRVKGGA